MCDEIIESYKEETSFNEIKAACKTKKFYIFITFLLITIALLIAVSTYCYLIKYPAKKNIYYHLTTKNNELKEIIY